MISALPTRAGKYLVPARGQRHDKRPQPINKVGQYVRVRNQLSSPSRLRPERIRRFPNGSRRGRRLSGQEFCDFLRQRFRRRLQTRGEQRRRQLSCFYVFERNSGGGGEPEAWWLVALFHLLADANSIGSTSAQDPRNIDRPSRWPVITEGFA